MPYICPFGFNIATKDYIGFSAFSQVGKRRATVLAALKKSNFVNYLVNCEIVFSYESIELVISTFIA